MRSTGGLLARGRLFEVNSFRVRRRHLCRSGRSHCTSKLALLDSLIDHDRQVATRGIDHRGEALRGGVDQEEKLREELFLARQGSQGCNFFLSDNLPVDDAELEGKLCVVLDPGRKRLGERNRITGGIGNR